MTSFGSLDAKTWDRNVPRPKAKEEPRSQLKEIVLSDEANPVKPEESWGFHLVINMSECNSKIDSLISVAQFFTDIIKELDMKTLSPLYIKKVSGEEGRGVSGVQMITTSSITFHSDDDKRSVYLDLFSCKNFDPKKAEAFACKYFQPRRHVALMIYRDAGLTGK